mgnify:FL=1
MKGMPKETLTQWKTEHIGRKNDILERVHSAIARISELVPMTTLHLKPIVIQRMPHRIVDKEVCLHSFCDLLINSPSGDILFVSHHVLWLIFTW